MMMTTLQVSCIWPVIMTGVSCIWPMIMTGVSFIWPIIMTSVSSLMYLAYDNERAHKVHVFGLIMTFLLNLVFVYVLFHVFGL